MTVYINIPGPAPPFEPERDPERRGVSVVRPITAAKEAVTVEQFAEHLSGQPGERHGKKIFFPCPLHDDHKPSLQVDPEKGVWFCFPCYVGGDVVRLAQLAWGYDHRDGKSAAEAAAMLLLEFGHQPPQRPPSWFRKQERQRPIRDAIGKAKFDHLCRRLFRLYFKDAVMSIQDSAERDAEYEILWDSTELLARMVLRDLGERRSP